MHRIEELRKHKNYTQVKVQILSGIDQSDYSKIERGLKDPTFWQCKTLAQIFDTSMDYIAGLTDEKTPYPRTKNKA